MTGFEVFLMILFIFNFCTLVFGFCEASFNEKIKYKVWTVFFPAYFIGYGLNKIFTINLGKKE